MDVKIEKIQKEIETIKKMLENDEAGLSSLFYPKIKEIKSEIEQINNSKDINEEIQQNTFGLITDVDNVITKILAKAPEKIQNTAVQLANTSVSKFSKFSFLLKLLKMRTELSLYNKLNKLTNSGNFGGIITAFNLLKKFKK